MALWALRLQSEKDHVNFQLKLKNGGKNFCNNCLENKLERRLAENSFIYSLSCYLSVKWAPSVTKALSDAIAVLIRWVPGLCQCGRGSVTKRSDRGFLNCLFPGSSFAVVAQVTICAFTAVQIHSHNSHSTQSAEHLRSIYPGNRKKETIARSSNTVQVKGWCPTLEQTWNNLLL